MPVLAGRLYSKTIILQGDPTSAPVNAGGPVPAMIVASPFRPAPWRSTTTTRIGDPNAAPAAPAVTPSPFLVQPAPRPAQRGTVILGAAGADIYFAGPLIATPVPQRPWSPPAVIVRQLQDGATGNTGAPVPTCLVVTQRPAPVLTPDVIALFAPPAPAPVPSATPPAVIVRVPPAGLRRGRIVIWTPPAVAPGAGAPPDVDTPTGLVLDAHEKRLTLDAHTSQLQLDAHQSSLTLGAHAMGLILDKGAALATPVFYTGDTWEPLKATAVDVNGNAVNISTATSIRMVAKRSSGTEIITGTTINDDDGSTPNRGRWEYVWALGDLAVAGDYIPELEVTWPGGPPTRIQTFRTDTEKFTVKADND